MKTLKILLRIVALGAITSCASVIVVSERDKTVDFSDYKTYNFLGWLQNSDQIWQGVARSTVIEDPQKREKAIPKKVATLMKKFPVNTIN